jgi:ParB-like chromosome segregation protein Spo0J
VRHLSPIEAIEAMLSENVNRSDLTVAEEVHAIERLMSLDEGLTPAKLCRRIGRSQAWVRSRMAVTILPARWRAALDTSELSLAAGEAAASVADLGPHHLPRPPAASMSPTAQCANWPAGWSPTPMSPSSPT